MPALSDKDQKRLSGYGLSREVEEAVAEVWSQRFGHGGTGEFVSFCIIALAAFPCAFRFFPSLRLESAYVWVTWGLCAAFVLLGAMMFSLLFGRTPHDVDSEAHRKFYLSRNVLAHVYAKGWKKRLGPTAAGMFTLSLLFTGHLLLTAAFAVSAIVLALGTSTVEVTTESFLKNLEEKLRRSPVWDSRWDDEPSEGRIIEGECVRVA